MKDNITSFSCKECGHYSNKCPDYKGKSNSKKNKANYRVSVKGKIGKPVTQEFVKPNILNGKIGDRFIQSYLTVEHIFPLSMKKL